MAETDGTPRYRKSKPPKGANGPGASKRNTRPNGKARKGAGLRDTLPSGAGSDTPTIEVNPIKPASAADRSQLGEGVVKTTMPTVIRTDLSADALADTYADVRSPSMRSTAPMPAARPSVQPRGARGALGSTLRMELTLQKIEGGEPRFQIRPTAQMGRAGRLEADAAPGTRRDEHAGHHDDENASGDLHDGSTTLQEGGKRSRKPTVPGFAPAFPDPSGRPLRAGQGTLSGAGAAAYSRLENTQRRGSDVDANSRSIPPHGAAPSMSTTGAGNRPRRPRRPGERTLILTARSKRGSKRDWVFVVLLVAALGLTASMFLSQQAPAEEVVDASAYDDPQAPADEQDPFAQSTLRPYKAQAEDSQSDTNALTAQAEAAAANSVQATELRTSPAGAEVVAGHAVVGNTPVRVARGSTDMVYVLRLAGHESKVVRVGPRSPASILVELGPLTPAQPPPDGAPVGQQK